MPVWSKIGDYLNVKSSFWHLQLKRDILFWHQVTWWIQIQLPFQTHKHIWPWASQAPIQLTCSTLTPNIKGLLLFHQQISSPPKNAQQPQLDQPNVPFSCILSFFLPWIWEESTTVSRTGPKCWADCFPQEVQQTWSSSLTVCLCGSSKRFCWRKSPFAWLVWSK